MKRKLPFAALALAVATFFAASAAHAQTTLNVNTSGTANANYDPFTANAGPFPASNFGVAVSASLGGTNVGLDVGGTSSFTLPAFTNGELLLPGISTVNIGYTPGFNGTLSSTSNFSANATFQYNVGPFSGSDNLFNQNLNATATGNIASGGTLLGGASANGSASGNLFNYSYTASAIVASASAGITVGANYQNSINWSATPQYGVYSWLSTTKGGAPTGTPQFSSVSSGALNYGVQNFGGSSGQQLYLNFEPGVSFVMAVTPSSMLSTPITGNLSAEAFGDTLINYNFPIATPFDLPINYQSWDVSGDWNSGVALSVPVKEENASEIPGVACINPQDNCVLYEVDGLAITYNSLGLPTSGPNSLNGGATYGMFNTGSNPGPLPNVCDPVTGICYASTDPNLPVGPGTVTTSVKEVGNGTTAMPEPGELPLLIIGLASMFLIARRSKGLAIAS